MFKTPGCILGGNTQTLQLDMVRLSRDYNSRAQPVKAAWVSQSSNMEDRVSVSFLNMVSGCWLVLKFLNFCHKGKS